MTAPAPATTETLFVNVIGDPAPQGSKRHVGNGRMIESSAKLGPWRDNVAWRVREAMSERGWTTLDAPCRVLIAFYVRRPASAPKSRRYPDRKPDIDKLVRAVLDALVTAGAVADDSRVVWLTATKHYATEVYPVGADIRIEEIR